MIFSQLIAVIKNKKKIIKYIRIKKKNFKIQINTKNFNTKKIALNKNYKINHLGVIMDGNRRWAKVRNIELNESYTSGGEKLQEIIGLCIENNINICGYKKIKNLIDLKDAKYKKIF